MENGPPYYYSDELEKQIGDALIEADIYFQRNQRLDFYLPAFNTYLEIKKYHSERSNAQLASEDNVILIQGKKSVNLFCTLLNGNK